MLKESALLPEDAASRRIVGAGDYFLAPVQAGQVLRIVDVEGNQAADTLFYRWIRFAHKAISISEPAPNCCPPKAV
jgi:uncharacterized protein YcgI (DUF1989 family)